MADWIKRHLSTAKHYASFSKDRTQCGCIAVSADNRVLCEGWNGFPRGVADTKERLENRDVKLELVVHSEQNCIYNAAYSGIVLKGSKFFVHAPIHVCNDCAKGIIQVGATDVFMTLDQTRLSDIWVEKWKTSSLLFKEARVRYVVYDMNDFDKVIEAYTGPGA